MFFLLLIKKIDLDLNRLIFKNLVLPINVSNESKYYINFIFLKFDKKNGFSIVPFSILVVL